MGEITVQKLHNQLETRGHCLLKGILSQAEIASWLETLERAFLASDSGTLRSRGSLYGSRSLLRVAPQVGQLAQLPTVRAFCEKVLGASWGVVRGLYFDKPPERSWTLPWHRDRTIAVKEHLPFDAARCDRAGQDCAESEMLAEFTNPTVKADIPHVVASDALLAQMLTLRIHLDPMVPENGPLVVQPGSHRSGTADDGLAQADAEAIEQITCAAGDIFVMRPLLAHSSLLSHSGTKLHRRTVHLELAPGDALPEPLHWHDFIPCQ